MNGAHLPLPAAEARDGAAGLDTFAETPAETPAEAASPATASCRNCDRLFDAHRIAPRFCPQCGQPAVVQPPPIGEAVREWVAENLSPQGTLGRTLALLVLRPGRLTALHVRGRRTRYLPPMKLYLGASFLFFLVLKFIASGPDVPVLVGHINVGMHRATPPRACRPARCCSRAGARRRSWW